MKLVAQSGEIFSHLFENPRMGVERDLYWCIHLELEPVELSGVEEHTSFQCDWLTLPIAKISDLGRMGIDHLRSPEKMEASLYLAAEHYPVEISKLAISQAQDGTYTLDMSGQFDIQVDGQRLCDSFHFNCPLRFAGILVIPENLDPSPTNANEVASAIAPFISMEGLLEPKHEGFRYVLHAQI